MNFNQLLRPEELTDAELVRILTSLDVAVSFNNPRSHLLDVYKRVALPLPQRQTRLTNCNHKPTNSTETRSSGELDLFKSVKREQVPVTHIVGNTKKMKLSDCWYRVSSPETIDEYSNERILPENYNVDSDRENLKRKLCLPFTDHLKRMKITS